MQLPKWKHMQHRTKWARQNRAMAKPPIQKPSQEAYVQSAVRLPPDLHAELKDSAERNGRSMNAEIIARLQAIPIDDQLNKLARDQAEIKTLAREILEVVSGK